MEFRYTRFRVLSLVILLFPAAVGLHIQAQTDQAPQEKPAWDVTLKSNAQATSNLDIENRCKGPHNFNIVKQDDLSFLEFLGPPQIRVAGRKSDKLPVRFNTSGMSAGQYIGNLLVHCVDCRAEPTCSQDREVLPVRLTVAPDESPAPDTKQPAPQAVAVPKSSPGKENQPAKESEEEEYFLPYGMVRVNRATALKWWASPFPPPGVNWCCCCCPVALPLVPPQPAPSRGPAAAPSAPTISIVLNLAVGKFGPGKAIHVLFVVGTPISAAQYLGETYVQWNASGGSGQLTVDLEVQRPGSSRWEKVVSGMGPNDEHLFQAHAPGTYTFRGTARDSAGKASFNTLTVSFPAF